MSYRFFGFCFLILSSFLSVGLWAQEASRENQIHEIANLLQTPGVEFAHCAEKMRALYDDLPRHETPDLNDTQLSGLVDLLGEAYFNFGSRSQDWFSSGQISEENVELFSSFNRVLLHALGEALFLQKVIRPLQLAVKLDEYDPLQKKKSEPVVFLAAPLKDGARFDSEGRLLNLSELLPEVVFASMLGVCIKKRSVFNKSFSNYWRSSRKLLKLPSIVFHRTICEVMNVLRQAS